MSLVAPRRAGGRRAIPSWLCERWPLLGGMALVALLVAAVGAHLRVVVLDEMVYKYAAAQYVERFPHELVDDRVSRGLARLYALVLALPVALLDGDVAVRAGRALNGLLWAATAIPTFCLARRVVSSQGWAAAAAVLAIAVPWLTVATILFSEALAYLLFACTVLAIVRALERPTPGRDLAVAALLAAAILARVQFVALVPAWLALVAWAEWPDRRRPRAIVRRRPVVAAGLVCCALAALLALAAGRFDDALRRAAGPYYGLRDRDALSGDFGLAALFEVEMLAIGVGVVPLVLACAFAWRAAAGRLGDAARRLAIVVAVLLGALFATTLFAQGGWLAERSEERYYIYAVPLVWVLAAAAVAHRTAGPRLLAAGGAALAAAATLVPVVAEPRGELVFLGPVSRVVEHLAPRLGDLAATVTGIDGILSARDATALAVLVPALVAAGLWRRGRPGLALVPAVAVQLGVAGMALAILAGVPRNTPDLLEGPSFAHLGWVDRAAGGASATLVEDPVGAGDGVQRDLVFWNDAVVDRVHPAGEARADALYPLSQVRAFGVTVGDDLAVAGLPPRPLAVQRATGPQLQLAGAVAGRRGDHELLRPGARPRARWLARGLERDGHVVRDVRLLAAGGHRVAIDVATPRLGAPVSLVVALGGQRRRFDGDATQEATLTFDLCDRTGAVAGTIAAPRRVALEDGRHSAGGLTAVRLLPCG
jgi:hypothetical protein